MKKYFLLLLLALAFFVRFYHPFTSFFWNVDEEIISLTVKRIVVDHTPQLIGFPIPGGIFLGPLLFYLISIPYLVTGMNPLGFPILSAFIGTFAVWLMYKGTHLPVARPMPTGLVLAR